jgi:hypothetical protein
LRNSLYFSLSSRSLGTIRSLLFVFFTIG